ncbi:MAG: TIGR01212 family radical SAM protein [Bacteroidaceae bacterium]|nr:TIGR01212 family radical SAM protein [Bacteroidaceae bacterium]
MEYLEFGAWLTSQLGYKAQKISINAGFTCPNRDGRVGLGGCTYCNNQSFNPDYCKTDKSISQQLCEGREFFRKKYPDMKYLAYFQAYTNTYGEFDDVIRKYKEALSVDDVVGLVIGTRPDCVSGKLLDYLQTLHDKGVFVLVEYGIESVHDKTLVRINRGHDFACTRKAVIETAKRGLPVGGHIILGLPGEDKNDILTTAVKLSELPITILKLHQLQIIKGTRMAVEYATHPEDFMRMTVDEYVDLVCEFIAKSRRDMIFERFVSQSPPDLLAVPGWGLKNYQFVEKIKRRLQTLPDNRVG